jgi:hypothetical protein
LEKKLKNEKEARNRRAMNNRRSKERDRDTIDRKEYRKTDREGTMRKKDCTKITENGNVHRIKEWKTQTGY